MTATFTAWCRPVTDRLATNARGYWRRYRWLVIATVIAAIADFITTVRFMYADGIEYELHPAIQFVSHMFGPVVGPLIGKLAQLAAIGFVTLYARRIAVYVFVVATILYAWAAWYNVWGRELYTPRLLEWSAWIW